MSQHVPESCNESNGSWLPLIEYSVRSGVSLSTIRRKIKSNSIQYRLEKGKYLILFAGEEYSRPVAPAPELQAPKVVPIKRHTDEAAFSRVRPQLIETRPPQHYDEADDTLQMVTDAFEHALREKEERLKLLEKRNQELEDRLNELRLLVQVLEEKYEVRY